MQNLKGTELLYRGIDWLRVGFYLKTQNKAEYQTFLEELKDIIRHKEYEERFINLEYINPITGEIEEIPLRVKTTAHIYPYVLMLVYEPLNISFRLGRPLREPEIENLRMGKSPTPNLMVEITGTALRPQKLPETQKVLSAFFNLLREYLTLPVGFTFSRIDYALDFTNREDAFRLLTSAEKLRKVVIQTPEEKITLSKSVKSLKQKLNEAIDYAKHIGVGDPRRLLIVYYKKTDADRYLQEFYFFQNFPYGLEIPHRIEARINSDYFKDKRKIFLPENLPDIENLIKLATSTALDNLPVEFKTYALQPHPIFIDETQLIHRELLDLITEETTKIVQKLTLQDEAMRYLSQLIRIKEEWNASAEDLINTLREMIESKHIRIIKKAKEKKMHPKQFLELLPKLYK